MSIIIIDIKKKIEKNKKEIFNEIFLKKKLLILIYL